MKKFKRLLSAALCAALIAISAVCGAGISAEETETANTAIEATPLSCLIDSDKRLNDWQFIGSNDMALVQSLGFTTASGYKIKANNNQSITEYEIDNIYGSHFFIGPKYSDGISLANSNGILIYVKTYSANDICLEVKLTTNASYTLIPKVGSEYKYAELGAEAWKTGEMKKGGQTNSDGSYGYFGFEGAFEGYVKIPFTSLVTGSGTAPISDFSQAKLEEVKLKFRTLGKTYETGAVAGPFMLITKDSDSTKINVPSDYKTGPIEVKTVNIGTVRADQSNFNIIQNSNSYCLSSETSVEVTGNVGNSNTVNFLMKPSIPLAPRDSEGFIIYLKTEKANDLAFSLEYEQKSWSRNWPPVMYLKPGQKVSVRKSTSDLWEDKEIVNGVDSTTNGYNVIYGKLTFTDAFEGYIRIPYSALNNDFSFTPNRNENNGAISRITQIACRFKGIGGTADNGGYGDITVGLEGYITADSTSGEFTASAPDYYKGDVNNDWSVDATDIAELRKYLLGISAEVNEVTANVNNDVNGTVDITDLVELNDIKP